MPAQIPPVPTTLQNSFAGYWLVLYQYLKKLVAVIAAFLGIAGAPVLIFRPGATGVLPPNVFTTFPPLYAATLPGAAVQVDTTFGAAVIPVAAYPNISILQGTPNSPDASGATALTIADGATFPNCYVIQNSLAVTTLASTTPPFTVADGGTFQLLAGATLSAGGAAASINFTPASGASPPMLIVGTNASIAARLSAWITPAAGATNGVSCLLNGGVIVSSSFVGEGSHSALATLNLYILAEQSYVLAGGAITMAGVATFAVFDRTATQTAQFSADASSTSGLATTLTIPAYRNLSTLPSGEGSVEAAGWLMGGFGMKNRIDVVLTGNGTSDGTTGTFQLYKNGVAVTGATFGPISLAGGAVSGSVSGFQSWHAPGDYYTYQVTSNQAIASAFHNISGGLR